MLQRELESPLGGGDPGGKDIPHLFFMFWTRQPSHENLLGNCAVQLYASKLKNVLILQLILFVF